MSGAALTPFARTFCIVVALAAGPAAAQVDPQTSVREAVQACADFMADRSTDMFDGPVSDSDGQVLHMATQEKAEVGLTLEFSHFVMELDGAPLPANVSCSVSGRGLSRLIWPSAGIRELFADAGDMIPTLVPRDVDGENGSWRYYDCADPAAPVDYSFRMHDTGEIWAQAQFPSLNEHACTDVVELKDLLFACVRAFAEGPWQRLRDAEGEDSIPGIAQIPLRDRLSDLVELGADGRATAETEIGGVDIRLEGGAAPTLCQVTGSVPFAQGEDAVIDWVASATTFFDGGVFPVADGRGNFICGAEFPDLALRLRAAPSAEGVKSFALSVTPVTDPAVIALCEGR